MVYTILCKKIADVNTNLEIDICLWSIFHKILCSRNFGSREFKQFLESRQTVFADPCFNLQ